MIDRFKFRVGFTTAYTDDNGDDRDIQLFIKGYFSVDCGGAGIVVHSSIIDEALNNTDLSLTEKKSVVKYLEANYCENDEYWLIDNLDFLEQCTGLKDKNGKLIYEGDIVKKGDTIAEVFWDDVCYAIRTRDGRVCWLWNNLYEVIGNIHENADLLRCLDDNK